MTTITYTTGYRERDACAYIASEKLDGYRARWNRGRLWLRSGTVVDAPEWWREQMPDASIEGELYIGRGQWHTLAGALRSKQPSASAWQRLRFIAFDLPDMTEPFHRRAAALRVLGRTAHSDAFDVVPMARIRAADDLTAMFHNVVAGGGEGIMLHHADALRPTDRGALVKMKPLHDAEAVVIEHIAGRGQHAGRLGALRVAMPTGQTFKLGTGFDASERIYPPRIGATITYSYTELTPDGVPRFARFVRERHAE